MIKNLRKIIKIPIFLSLGQKYFFSLAKSSEIFIGNSSSGIFRNSFFKSSRDKYWDKAKE